MLEPRVIGPGIDKMSESQLFDSTEALQEGVLDKVENDFERYFDESVDRIVDYLQLIGGRWIPHMVFCVTKVCFYCHNRVCISEKTFCILLFL